MRRSLTRAILMLYPRAVRHGHGPEMVALIDDLIVHEGRSRARLFLRLAVDGLAQRIVATATACTVAAILAATGLGSLAVSDLAAASAHQRMPRTVHSVLPASHAYQAPRRQPGRRRTRMTVGRGARATIHLSRALANPGG